MNKIFKTILISLLAIFGSAVLVVLPTKATALPLVVEYSTDGGSNWLPLAGPIFNETNFLPGNGVVRLIRVTNNSEQTQRIATEAINKNDPDNFASQMNLTIKEDATVIFDNTLAQFFSQGETYLSSLASGAQTQYDFTITFDSGSGNEYQEKMLGFDILVGFEGTEGGLPLPPSGEGTSGGGDGGYLPPGLTIQDESIQSTEVGTTSITLIWTTSYLSTSQVIYDTVPGKFKLNPADGGGPPNYGYAYSKEGDDIFGSGKGMNHQVTITGLSPSTTYYYRAVSHGSLAISQERSFTTLGIAIGEKTEEETSSPSYEITSSGQGQTLQEEGVISIEEGGTQESSEETPGKELITEKTEVEQPITGLLAAIEAIPFNLRIILIILGIIILGLIILQLTRKREIKS